MINITDKDYKQTKKIKQGKATLKPAFKELADWINVKYHVTVLNIYQDSFISAHKRVDRLSIIFETEEEELLFSDGRLLNFHADKQKEIADKYYELKYPEDRNKNWIQRLFTPAKYNANELLVIFDSFMPLAREEANGSIPESAIAALKVELNNSEIWEIAKAFSFVTFFFYTDQQKESVTQDYVDLLTDKYFAILKQYDEFNYFDRESFSIRLDSKQNFDENFQSSWFYYYR